MDSLVPYLSASQNATFIDQMTCSLKAFSCSSPSEFHDRYCFLKDGCLELVPLAPNWTRTSSLYFAYGFLRSKWFEIVLWWRRFSRWWRSWRRRSYYRLRHHFTNILSSYVSRNRATVPPDSLYSHQIWEFWQYLSFRDTGYLLNYCSFEGSTDIIIIHRWHQHIKCDSLHHVRDKRHATTIIDMFHDSDQWYLSDLRHLCIQFICPLVEKFFPHMANFRLAYRAFNHKIQRHACHV